MSVDPMALVRSFQPKPAVDIGTVTPGALRRVRDTVVQDHAGNNRSLAELAANPSKIPPPACARCGEDHQPNKTYSHEYAREIETSVSAGVSGRAVEVESSPITPTVLATVPAKRVSIFSGRDDGFVLIVEQYEDGDWEDAYKTKVVSGDLLAMMPVLRALGVKIKDRTGGDLTALDT